VAEVVGHADLVARPLDQDEVARRPARISDEERRAALDEPDGERGDEGVDAIATAEAPATSRFEFGGNAKALGDSVSGVVLAVFLAG
jgi:hypothetical protein